MKNNYIKQKRKDQNPVNHWKIFEGRLVFLMAMVILAVVAYTFILQQAYTKTALKTEIERDISRDRKSTRLNSSHTDISRMPSSA